MPALSTPLPDYPDGGSVTYTGNASTTDFAVPYDYIGKTEWAGTRTSQLRVYTGTTWATVTENTTWTQPNASTVRISPAPASGLLILIRRDSQPLDKKLDFADGGRLTASQLDLMYLQAMYCVQEANDRIKDMRSLLLAAGTVGNTYTFVAPGGQTTWALGTERGLTAGSLLVSVNNIFQDTGAYSVTDVLGVSNITFTSAPGGGNTVRVRVLTGGTLPVSEPGPGTVGPTQLQDGAVTFAKTDFSASGTNNQFLGKRSGAATFSTLLASDISNLAAIVQAYRLDQFAVPTASLNANSQKVINLATPTANTDGANKQYVDTQVSTALTGTIDQGRTLFGSFTATSTTGNILMGFAFDVLLVWPDYGLVSGLRGASPTARIANGGTDVGFEPIVYASDYGDTANTWKIQISGNEGQLKLTRSGAGFSHQLLTAAGSTSGVTSRRFNYLAIRNSNG